MVEFNQTLWADANFASEYRDNADYYIPDRQYLYSLVRSFYRFHVGKGHGSAVCDLGCGDGALAHQLLQKDASIKVTLQDGSGEMLEAARRRLGDCPSARFVQCGFDALIRREVEMGPFDFVASAFAIHHLVQTEKAALFQAIFELLNPGGCFVNVDTTFPSHARATDWYYRIWRQWIKEQEKRSPRADSFLAIPGKARRNPDNKLSSLTEQLHALQEAGFQEVECHYRNGLFTIYSGRKISSSK